MVLIWREIFLSSAKVAIYGSMCILCRFAIPRKKHGPALGKTYDVLCLRLTIHPFRSLDVYSKIFSDIFSPRPI